MNDLNVHIENDGACAIKLLFYIYIYGIFSMVIEWWKTWKVGTFILDVWKHISTHN